MQIFQVHQLFVGTRSKKGIYTSRVIATMRMFRRLDCDLHCQNCKVGCRSARKPTLWHDAMPWKVSQWKNRVICTGENQERIIEISQYAWYGIKVKFSSAQTNDAWDSACTGNI